MKSILFCNRVSIIHPYDNNMYIWFVVKSLMIYLQDWDRIFCHHVFGFLQCNWKLNRYASIAAAPNISESSNHGRKIYWLNLHNINTSRIISLICAVFNAPELDCEWEGDLWRDLMWDEILVFIRRFFSRYNFYGTGEKEKI